jgi:hypothetical protein
MATWVARQRRRTYEVGEMFGQLMGAVAFLHRRGVSVRTLSLGTVLVAQDCAPLLVDVEPLPAGAGKGMLLTDTAAPKDKDKGKEPPSAAPPPPSSSFMAMSLSAMAPKAAAAAAKSKAAAQVGVPPGMQWAAKPSSTAREPVPPPVSPPATWGGFGGVVGYQAPELEAGGEPSPLSDLWAVGIMMFHTVFPTASAVPDAATGGVVVPPHEDESLRSLLAGLLRTAPQSRLQSADRVLAQPFFATDVLVTEPLVQTEWKVKLLRQFGRRLQAGRAPLRIEVSLTHVVDSTLTTFASLYKGNLVQPLHVTFIHASSALQMECMPTLASLYTTFFTQVRPHAPRRLHKLRTGSSRVWHGATETGLGTRDTIPIPHFRGVRVHVSTGHDPGEGNRQQSRDRRRELSLPPGIPNCSIRTFFERKRRRAALLPHPAGRCFQLDVLQTSVSTIPATWRNATPAQRNPAQPGLFSRRGYA